MAEGPFGLTFAPTADAAAEAKAMPNGGEQSATQIVNVALPRVLGSRAPASEALLRPHVRGGVPDRAVLQSVLRALLGGDVELPSEGMSMGAEALTAPAAAGRVSPFSKQVGESSGEIAVEAQAVPSAVPFVRFGGTDPTAVPPGGGDPTGTPPPPLPLPAVDRTPEDETRVPTPMGPRWV